MNFRNQNQIGEIIGTCYEGRRQKVLKITRYIERKKKKEEELVIYLVRLGNSKGTNMAQKLFRWAKIQVVVEGHNRQQI